VIGFDAVGAFRTSGGTDTKQIAALDFIYGDSGGWVAA